MVNVLLEKLLRRQGGEDSFTGGSLAQHVDHLATIFVPHCNAAENTLPSECLSSCPTGSHISRQNTNAGQCRSLRVGP